MAAVSRSVARMSVDAGTTAEAHSRNRPSGQNLSELTEL